MYKAKKFFTHVFVLQELINVMNIGTSDLQDEHVKVWSKVSLSVNKKQCKDFYHFVTSHSGSVVKAFAL